MFLINPNNGYLLKLINLDLLISPFWINISSDNQFIALTIYMDENFSKSQIWILNILTDTIYSRYEGL